jgi:RNA polymerase sigma factor (sigma-70 family)
VNECLEIAVQESMPAWRRFAYTLTRDETNAKDLVSETLLKILENQRDKAEELACENRLLSYVHRAIYFMAIDDSSRYGMKYMQYADRWSDYDNAFDFERDEPWLGSRLDNELLDTYIQLMPERDAILLRLYMLDGFDYKDVSDKTNIPIKRLYKYISNAIKKIRKDVHRTTSHSG